MKKVIISSLLIVTGLVYFGCKKKSIVEFDIPYTTDFVISASTTTPGVNYYYSDITTNVASHFEQNNLNSNIVGEYTCTMLELKVKGPGGAKLNAMKNYEIFLNAGSQKQVRFAHISPWMEMVPTQTIVSSSAISTTISPVIMKLDGFKKDEESGEISNSNNVKNYFIEPTVTMKLKAYPHNTVSTTYTLTANFILHVKGIN